MHHRQKNCVRFSQTTHSYQKRSALNTKPQTLNTKNEILQKPLGDFQWPENIAFLNSGARHFGAEYPAKWPEP